MSSMHPGHPDGTPYEPAVANGDQKEHISPLRVLTSTLNFELLVSSSDQITTQFPVPMHKLGPR